MATVKSHFADVHERLADACDDRASHDEAIAECEKADGYHEKGLHHAAKAMGMKKLAAWHRDQAAMLKSAAADDLAKSAVSSSMNELAELVRTEVARQVQEVLSKTIVRDNVSAIPRIDTPLGGFGINAPRAVMRPGQPDVSVDKAAIPPQFRHLVELGEEV